MSNSELNRNLDEIARIRGAQGLGRGATAGIAPGIPNANSILDRVTALEQNAQQNDASLTKVIEELYMRIGQLEQLVRG